VLKVNKTNSIGTHKNPFPLNYQKRAKLNFPLGFKFMDMAKGNALIMNQCP